ncbi:MAG: NADH-quinone oxidoreductase subunit N [Myxococcota bacterium]
MNSVSAQLEALAPLCIVALATLLLVMLDAIATSNAEDARENELGVFKGTFLSLVAGAALLLAMLSAAYHFEYTLVAVVTPASMMKVDGAASFAMMLLCAGALLTVWYSLAYLPAMNMHHGEFYPLLLFSVAGALAVVCASNLISLFVAIELMSLPVYALAGFDRDRSQSSEAGLRALLMGAFASAISLYGIALIYGATGHFDYSGLGDPVTGTSPLALAGFALLLVGLLTKLGAAPFHAWLPDSATGAPTVVASMFQTLVLCASAFALVRVIDAISPKALPGFVDIMMIAGAASMLVGSVMALAQDNVRRMLAYAAVAHAGFLLCAIAIPTAAGRGAAFLHVATFVFIQLGAWGAVSAVADRGVELEKLSDYEGLAQRRPILAAAATIFLLALAGMPGTAGFISRLVVMSSTVGAGHIALTVLMGAASVVLFAAYLRVPTAMYMGRTDKPQDQIPPLPAVFALIVCAFLTIYFGLFPGEGPMLFNLLEMVGRASQS